MLRAAARIARFSVWQLPSIDHKPKPYTGPSYETVLSDRKGFMPIHFHSYK